MWQNLKDSVAKRVVLEDGISAIAVVKPTPEGSAAVLFSDVEDFDRIELESERLGTIADLIDVLLPQDIIEIYCQMQKNSSEPRSDK